MRYIFSIILVFLLIPVFAFSQEVTVLSDAGLIVTITLDQSAQDVYAKTKAEFGDDVLEHVIEDWFIHHSERYARNVDIADLKDRLDSLTQTKKQKVLDLLDACKLGDC